MNTKLKVYYLNSQGVGVIEGYAPYMGEGGVAGQRLGRGEGGESQKGMHHTWGLVSVEREVFEWLSRGVKGDAFPCRGNPTCFIIVLE